MKLIIQIPCYNEEEILPVTLADLPREVEGFDEVEWLVIDDGSSDATHAVALEHGVDHVVTVPQNQGLANAFTTGLDACLKLGADVIVNTDADNQYRGSSIHDLVAPVVAQQADMVVGERPIEHVDDFSRAKKRLQRAGSWVVRRFSGTDVRDAASGFRAFDREAAMRLQVYSRYSYTMETIVQAGWEGLSVVSVPIEVNAKTRDSRLVRSIPRYIWNSGSTIVRSFALYKPMRFFFIIGLLPFAITLVLVARWFYLQLFTDDEASRVPSLVAAAVFAIITTQIWVVGLLADLLAANRRLSSELLVRVRRTELEVVGPDQRTDTTADVDSAAQPVRSAT